MKGEARTAYERGHGGDECFGEFAARTPGVGAAGKLALQVLTDKLTAAWQLSCLPS